MRYVSSHSAEIVKIKYRCHLAHSSSSLEEQTLYLTSVDYRLSLYTLCHEESTILPAVNSGGLIADDMLSAFLISHHYYLASVEVVHQPVGRLRVGLGMPAAREETGRTDVLVFCNITLSRYHSLVIEICPEPVPSPTLPQKSLWLLLDQVGSTVLERVVPSMKSSRRCSNVAIDE
ncbi:hypothetical protein PM082_013706 [Marasmius tenuissimus]|nr:hypothetical protein PM082_013706 [Marasmius tenuissimus]